MIKIPRHFYAREGLFCASAHHFTLREGYSAQQERFAEIIMCHSLIFFVASDYSQTLQKFPAMDFMCLLQGICYNRVGD